MNKLKPFQSRFIFLYTTEGDKLLGRPLHEDHKSPSKYLFELVGPSDKYPTQTAAFSNEEIGYVVELPEELQEGIKATLELANTIHLDGGDGNGGHPKTPAIVEFGMKKKKQ